MTETLTNPDALPTEISALLENWVETPPPSLSAALAERGISVEALEEFARSGIPTDQIEALRKVLVQGAASGRPEDAAILARLTPVLDPRERAWDRVLKAKTSGEILTATVTEAVKGGVVVDLGVRGFVPSSQIGLNVPRNLNQFVGRPLRLRVIEVDRRRGTVILSNRQILEEERADKRRTALGNLEEGEERTGTVRRLTDIGAFVDVGGVDGLLHVSEISWKRVDRPSDVLKVGDKIQVRILKVDPDAGRVSLSMRRLSPDPWEMARRKYMPGTTVKVKIARTVPQGAVVELEDDIEGFIPISELAGRRVSTPEEVVQPDQEVEALVTEFRPRERRIILSLRKLEFKKERQVVDNYQRKARSTSERTTLGDLFGHLFAEYSGNHQETEEAADGAGAGAAGETAASDESGAVDGAVAAAEPAATADTVGEAVSGHEGAEEPAAAVPAPDSDAAPVTAQDNAEPEAAEDEPATEPKPEAAAEA